MGPKAYENPAYGTDRRDKFDMAKSGAIWGIEIGQCSLKALRCAISDDGQELSALAFDHIEYPQILSQADADPITLVHDALELFLSRNEVRGDRVALSVPGQTGLARFIKLPPVESKKLAAIVSYEAKQQIPFPLEEVVWDYQKMPGGSEDEGFALETEVGLFAMKRDQVFRAIKPLDTVGIELDIIQLAPLALYNFAVFDQMRDLMAVDQYDLDKPPESLALISVGTDATDLVITNGYRVWQRSIPLGGSHFTKQLTKELKLTFAKAEHLKRNAQEAQDSKAIFQAMRPVFKEFVTELQRSIGFFQNLDRNAMISRIMVLGNAFKLPGLGQYVEKSLGIQLRHFEKPRHLSGSGVVSTPTFEENVMTFPVCYGLCVQGLGKSIIQTNLLPREILHRRMIRQKKPWAVCAVAAVLLGLMCHYFFTWNAWSKVHDSLFSQVLNQTNSVHQESTSLQQTDQEKIAQYDKLKTIGEAIVVDDEGRRLFLELLKAVYTALPRDPDAQSEDTFSKPYEDRRNLYVQSVDSKYFENLSDWWNEEIEGLYLAGKKRLGIEEESSDPVGAVSADNDPNDPKIARNQNTLPNVEEASTGLNARNVAGKSKGGKSKGGKSKGGKGANRLEGPKGVGWVYELRGYHFFNSQPGNQGSQYVRNTLIRNLLEGVVELPDGPDGAVLSVKMDELGIRFPVLVHESPIETVSMPNLDYDEQLVLDARMEAQETGEALPDDLPPEIIQVPRCEFTVQFCWQETPVSKRRELRLEQEQKNMGNNDTGDGDQTGGLDAVARSGDRDEEERR